MWRVARGVKRGVLVRPPPHAAFLAEVSPGDPYDTKRAWIRQPIHLVTPYPRKGPISPRPGAITVYPCRSCQVSGPLRDRRLRPTRFRIAPRFVPAALQDRQVRVAWEARIGRGTFAEAERGPAAGLDDPRMPARRAQTRRWGSHVATPVKASVARWRRGWDSNPRSLSTLRFSRAPPSTARPPLRRQA